MGSRRRDGEQVKILAAWPISAHVMNGGACVQGEPVLPYEAQGNGCAESARASQCRSGQRPCACLLRRAGKRVLHWV